MTAPSETAYSCLLTDWGGVLTEPTSALWARWVESSGVDAEALRATMRHLDDTVDSDPDNPMVALECGRITEAEFGVYVAGELTRRSGRPHDPEGLIESVWLTIEHDHAMQNLVRRLRASGVRVVLVSNSWGNPYRRESWDELFDELVISGEVGLRKPDARIYDLAVEVAGHPRERCLFIDDMQVNVEAARATGLAAIQHVDFESTLPALERYFARTLA